MIAGTFAEGANNKTLTFPNVEQACEAAFQQADAANPDPYSQSGLRSGDRNAVSRAIYAKLLA